MMSDSHTTQSIPLSSPSSPPSISMAGMLQFLEISPDGLLVVDEAGSIVQVNGQVEALFGYSREELIGRPLDLLLPQRFRAAHAAHRARYFSTPRMRPMGIGLDLVGRRRDGTEFPVEISLNPVLMDGALHALGAVRDVSLQRAAEREHLRQSRQISLQGNLINLAHDAILVRDQASRVLLWNGGAEELYGWTAQEAQGRVTHSLLKTRFPIELATIAAQLKRDGRWEGELVHTRRDGSFVTVESRQVLLRDEEGGSEAILEINRDITMRRESEQIAQTMYLKTAERLSFIRQVLDALPSGIYLVYGPQARLLLANRTATSVWGADWHADQPMLEFLAANRIKLFDAQGHPLRAERYATLRAVRRGEAVLQQEETIQRPDGSRLPVLINALPLLTEQGSGQLVREGESIALVVQQDVTVLKEAESLKDEFVGIVAHELRAPLSALQGFADMLLVQTARGHGPHLADWQLEALQEIEIAVKRLTGLTEELLDVTRLQTGRLQLERSPTDLVSLTRRVAGFLQQSTTRHQLEVRVAHEHLIADVDPGRIEQVLTNLLGNGIKYSPQGGPVTITLREETEAGLVRISVQDHGIGIPASQQAQVFGRFMRADNAQVQGISGTGLGLYISRELVEQHDGHLWFESEEGVGSTFTLTLPATSDAAPAIEKPVRSRRKTLRA